jgi:hypothetical protein
VEDGGERKAFEPVLCGGFCSGDGVHGGVPRVSW